jgi:hypothetical protein
MKGTIVEQKSKNLRRTDPYTPPVVPITDPARLLAAGQVGQIPPQTAAEIIAANGLETIINSEE